MKNQFSIVKGRIARSTLVELAAQVNVVYAFADTRYLGNPAGVLVSSSDPDPSEMVALARHMDLPVIVTLVPKGPEKHYIRWFTMNAELALCGHGTMAASYVLFSEPECNVSRVLFETTSSGLLTADLRDGLITLTLPSLESTVADEVTSHRVHDILNVEIEQVRRADDDIIAVLESDSDLTALKPNLDAISQLDCRGLVVTAHTNPTGILSEFDIVSRFFAPQIGIDEDEVCISAHCKLQPIWQQRLDCEQPIRAFQASPNGGAFLLGGGDGVVTVTGGARSAVRTTELKSQKQPVTLDCHVPSACGIRAVVTELADKNAISKGKNFSMAHFRVEPGGVTEPHEHSVSEIWCIVAGKAEVISDGLSEIIEPGNFVQLLPHSSHQLRNIGFEPVLAVSVWWDPEAVHVSV